MMTRNHRQEALSRAYIHAVAARCGMTVAMSNPDYRIDMTLNEIILVNGRLAESGFKLDIQARSTTLAGISENEVRYDLDIPSYDVLRWPMSPIPRFLVLLVLPKDETAWSSQSEEELILRRCAYWLSLEGLPSVQNRRSIRLSIPRQNVFSPEVVQQRIRYLKSGERT